MKIYPGSPVKFEKVDLSNLSFSCIDKLFKMKNAYFLEILKTIAHFIKTNTPQSTTVLFQRRNSYLNMSTNHKKLKNK